MSYGSRYDKDLAEAKANAPSKYCRVCDCRPCMCGRKDYASDREYEKRLKDEQERYKKDREYGGG